MSRRFWWPALCLMVLQWWTPPWSIAATPRWILDAVQAAPSSANPRCGYRVVFDRRQMKVQSNRISETRRRRVVQIHKSSATDVSGLQILLEPGADLIDFRAWLIREREAVTAAGLEQVIQANVSSVGYADTRLATLSLQDVRKGDLLAYEAIWRQPEPFSSTWWVPQEDLAPVVRAELVLELPKGWGADAKCHGEARAVPSGPTNPLEIVWNKLPEQREEERSAGVVENLPRVFVRFDPPSASARLDTWEKVSSWYAELSRSSGAPAHCPVELLPPTGLSDRRAWVRDLTLRVQKRLRYVAIELGHQRWIPDRADSTWQRGFGDCKDKAAVAVSALQRSGVEAVPVLVRTRSIGDVRADSPDPAQFNHVVVAIAWDGDSTLMDATITGRDGRRWVVFDPTAESIPIGMIPSSIGGARGLLAVPGETLITIPEAARSIINMRVTGDLDETGAISGHLEMWIEGPDSEELKARMSASSSAALSNGVRAWILERWPTARVDTCQRIFRARGANGAGLSARFVLPALGHRTETGWSMSPRFFFGTEQPAPRDSVRRTPILIGQPVVSSETWEVRVPEGWSSSPVQPLEWKGTEGRYRMETTHQGPRLQWARYLEIPRRASPVERYAQAREFLQAIYSGDHLPTMIRHR